MNAPCIRVTKEMSKDAVIVALIPLARRIAAHLARRLPAHIRLDDLRGSGMVGAVEAASRFDPERIESFVGYAALRIGGAIRDELRRGDILSQEARNSSRRLGETIRELTRSLGRPPESSEIASALGMSEDEYRKNVEPLADVQMVSIDEVDDWHETDGNADACKPDDLAARREMRRFVARGVDNLPEREKRIVFLYYGHELTLKEIGDQLDLTASRVCQLHAQAVARLRDHLPTLACG